MPTDKESPQTRRGGENQVLGTGGKPLLVIVEGRDINAMVEAGLEAIGGLGRVIGNHTQVLLKPNTNQRDPFPSITAPDTLCAVADHCRIAGAEHIVVHEDHKWELDPYYTSEDLPGMEIQISHSSEAGHYVLVEYEKWHGDLDPDVDFVDVEHGSSGLSVISGQFLSIQRSALGTRHSVLGTQAAESFPVPPSALPPIIARASRPGSSRIPRTS